MQLDDGQWGSTPRQNPQPRQTLQLKFLAQKPMQQFTSVHDQVANRVGRGLPWPPASHHLFGKLW
jgi:hypothetical protein